jgi:hypothetical protein
VHFVFLLQICSLPTNTKITPIFHIPLRVAKNNLWLDLGHDRYTLYKETENVQ